MDEPHLFIDLISTTILHDNAKKMMDLVVQITSDLATMIS